MKKFDIGFIDGHSLKYKFETVTAKTQKQAINYLFYKWGKNFDHIITSISIRG